MKLVNIEATTLSDAWFQCVYKCIEMGRDFIVDRGSYEGDKRLEFDYVTVRIKQPWHEPVLPKIPEQYNLPDPVDPDHLYGGEGYDRSYVEYLMSHRKEPGESYTYGERLTKKKLMEDEHNRWRHKVWAGIFLKEKEAWENEKALIHEYQDVFLNQIELLIWTYKNKGPRNNQMVLQVARPEDMLLQDPPCLRQIDTRIQDNTLHFFPYFRSWDLWGGFPENLAAIEYMKQYIASELKVENGEIIASSKGLHLYSYVWELAECLRGKTIEEFKMGK